MGFTVAIQKAYRCIFWMHAYVSVSKKRLTNSRQWNKTGGFFKWLKKMTLLKLFFQKKVWKASTVQTVCITITAAYVATLNPF